MTIPSSAQTGIKHSPFRQPNSAVAPPLDLQLYSRNKDVFSHAVRTFLEASVMATLAKTVIITPLLFFMAAHIHGPFRHGCRRSHYHPRQHEYLVDPAVGRAAAKLLRQVWRTVKERLGSGQPGADRHAGFRRHANRLWRRNNRSGCRRRRAGNENHREPQQPRKPRPGRAAWYPIAPKTCAANASAFKVSVAVCGKPQPSGWNISAWMSDATTSR